MALIGQHGEECLHLGCSHVARMPHGAALPVPADEKSHPIQIGLFSLKAVVQTANALANLVRQAGRAQKRCVGFHGRVMPVYMRHQAHKPMMGRRFMEKVVTRISRTIQLIPPVLRDTLRALGLSIKMPPQSPNHE